MWIMERSKFVGRVERRETRHLRTTAPVSAVGRIKFVGRVERRETRHLRQETPDIRKNLL